MVASVKEIVAKRFPCGDQAVISISLEGRIKSLHVVRSKMYVFCDPVPKMTLCPSGDMSMFSGRNSKGGTWQVTSSRPVTTFHTCIVPSSPVMTIRVLSGDHTTLRQPEGQ